MGTATLAPSPASEVVLSRFQASLDDSDTATAQTIRIMVQDHIQPALNDSEVQSAAKLALQAFRGGPGFQGDPNGPEAIAYSCWWFAKQRMRFVHHEDMMRRLLGESDQLQLLISPSVIVRQDRPAGDCAVYTLLICALLKCNGLDYEIVTTASDPHRPNEFSHVFPRAVLPDGSRVTLDASHGSYPGWEVPRAHQLRRQVWNERGRPVRDQVSAYDGLHGYVGLGDDTADANAAFLAQQNFGGFAPEASSGSGWSQFFQDIAKQWTAIGARVVAPTTTVTQTRQGYQLTTPAGTSTGFLPSVSGISGNSWLWLAVLGIAAVVAVKALKRD